MIRHSNEEVELFGGDSHTTNNQMELLAVIRALEHIPAGSVAHVHTDSQYVQKGITEWIHGWKRRGWVTAGKEPVKNADLWRTLDQLASKHRVTWSWVKGHAGHPDNERADTLARRGVAASRRV